jgi:hypothetical protein
MTVLFIYQNICLLLYRLQIKWDQTKKKPVKLGLKAELDTCNALLKNWNLILWTAYVYVTHVSPAQDREDHGPAGWLLLSYGAGVHVIDLL